MNTTFWTHLHRIKAKGLLESARQALEATSSGRQELAGVGTYFLESKTGAGVWQSRPMG